MPLTLPVNDILNPRFFTGFVAATPIPRDFIGFDLFPEREVPSDRIEWAYLQNEYQLAPFVAPGAESPQIDWDERISRAFASARYVRNKATLHENDVRVLRALGDAASGTVQGNMAAEARRRIARATEIASQQVDSRLEKWQIDSMLGSVTIAPTSDGMVGRSNVQFSYTFPVRTATPVGADWDAPTTADPYLDMRTWFNEIAQSDRPFTPRRAVMSTITWNTLANNQQVARQMFLASRATDAGLPSILTNQQLETFFGTIGLRVTLYDAMYTTRDYSAADGTFTTARTRFLPEGVIAFLPDGALGYTATVPAPQNNWRGGKFGFPIDPDQSGRLDPWVYEVVAGYYGVPILERPYEVLIATVYTP